MVDQEHEVCRRLFGLLGSLNDTGINMIWLLFLGMDVLTVMRDLWRRI
jgi:hypothetical protein